MVGRGFHSALGSNLRNRYSINVLLTVAESRSPNATMGAITSPRLNCSVVVVKAYSGLNALEANWRATLLLANMAAVTFSSVQYALVVSKIVWLKRWLFPKKASERLYLVG